MATSRSYVFRTSRPLSFGKSNFTRPDENITPNYCAPNFALFVSFWDYVLGRSVSGNNIHAAEYD